MSTNSGPRPQKCSKATNTGLWSADESVICTQRDGICLSTSAMATTNEIQMQTQICHESEAEQEMESATDELGAIRDGEAGGGGIEHLLVRDENDF